MTVFQSDPLKYLGQENCERMSYYSIFDIKFIISMKSFPAVFYGTAWKKQKTAELVQLAIRTGFRAIDTACQPKHYNEKGVGDGIAKSGLPRQQLFIQTKYTPIGGQDKNNVPYNPKDNIPVQVRTSLEVSLKNLQTNYLDSLVLHSPMGNIQETVQVWRVFEEFIDSGKVKHLGISNCYNFNFFKTLYETVKVKPTFIQNRFYSDSGYDVQLRNFCKENKVFYQSFWTLTANPHIINSQPIKKLANKYKIHPEQVFYLTLIQDGIIPLIGTTSKIHMEEDIAMLKVKIQQQDMKRVWALLK